MVLVVKVGGSSGGVWWLWWWVETGLAEENK